MQHANQLHPKHMENAIDLAVLQQLNQTTDKWYSRIDELSTLHGAFEVAKLLPTKANYLPTASSIALEAVMPVETLINALSGKIKRFITSNLGSDAVCSRDIAWLRRQYPACFDIAIATPHGWHQDGAYGLDFSTTENKNQHSLLSMITVWLPLDECGEHAPGLELIQDSPETVQLPSQLQESEIRQHWPKDSFWRPKMKPGDALLIPGHTLHRTFRTDSMTDFRGCVELRFVSSQPIPKRLQDHHYISLL